MARIALLGGSFDPPTLGHASTARNVLDSGLVDELWFVPAGDDRYDRDAIVAGIDRREMIARLIEDEFPGETRIRIESAQVEGRIPGSATIDLLDYLRGMSDQNKYLFVIGSDNLSKLPGWRAFDRLVKEVRFLVVPRPGEAIPEPIPSYVSVIDGGAPSIASSSEARAALRAGGDVSHLLSPRVRAFVVEKKLYGAE